MASKKERNRIQVDATGFKDKLQAMADAEDRSLSYICAKLIKQSLESRKIIRENCENNLSPLQQALKFLNLEKVAENSRIPLERLREIQQGSCPDYSEISGLIRAGIDPEILKECQKHNQQKENQNANSVKH